MKKLTIVAFVVVALLGAILCLALQQGAMERRGLRSAVTDQIDRHSSKITALLTSFRATNLAVAEDSIFQELQGVPSSSLISRSMIRVRPAEGGRLECVIDVSRFGISPRTIQGAYPNAPGK